MDSISFKRHVSVLATFLLPRLITAAPVIQCIPLENLFVVLAVDNLQNNAWQSKN